MNRSEIIRQNLNIATGRGLEIGALCRPLVAPNEGRIRYADHQSTADLRSKYMGHGDVDLDAIVDVHYVVGDHGLRAAVGDDRFDYVIASHVVEHVPNPIGWLKDVAAILEPNGILSLVIPDMRFTYDCSRALTTTAAVVEAYMQGRKAPSFGQILDSVLETRLEFKQAEVDAVWAGTCDIRKMAIGSAELVATLDEAVLRGHYDAISSGAYHDVHCSVWTPESFLQMLTKLSRLGLVDFELATFGDTALRGMEFYCSLKKLPEGLSVEKRQAMALKALERLTPTRFNKPAAFAG